MPSKKQGIIYAPQDSGRVNITPALEYGTITSFSSIDCPISRVGQTYDAVSEWLFDFDPSKDFLLLVGDPVLISLCVAYLAKTVRTIPMLKWDRQERKYITMAIVFPGEEV